MNQFSDNGTSPLLVQSANKGMKSCRNARSQSTVAGVWPLLSSADGEPERAALLTCDIRRGPPEQRAELARALVDCVCRGVHREATTWA